MKTLVVVFSLCSLALAGCDKSDDSAKNAETAAKVAGDKAGAAADKAGEMAGDAKDKAGEMAGEAGDMAGDAKDKAGEMAGEAGDKAGEMAGEAGEMAGDAKDKAGEMAGDAKDAVEGAMATKDIVEVATEAGSFKTLLTAATEAGLVETLKGDGPFTVFAPTDDAFAKLPKGAIEALLKDKAKLKELLTYHVVAGKVMAADVAKMAKATTVAGGDVMIDAKNGVKINDAKVIKADIIASNGVIHVIDTVLVPKK